MKWRRLTILALLTVPLSGCMGTNTECDWTRTIPFGSQQSIDWLLENDRQLLVGVTTHNEARQEICR
jgi:hypothetical protein